MTSHSDKSEAVLEPTAEALAMRLLETFHFVHAVHCKVLDDSLIMMNESGLTVPQLVALHVLRFDGDHSVGEIADRTRLSKPATSHLVERLVSMQLVDRTEDEHDRRQKQVSLNAKGLALMDKLFQAKLAVLAAGLECLSNETRSRLFEALADTVQELKQHASSCCEQSEAGL
jgi:DNA-binding MarR family transcriptional regulator